MTLYADRSVLGCEPLELLNIFENRHPEAPVLDVNMRLDRAVGVQLTLHIADLYNVKGSKCCHLTHVYEFNLGLISCLMLLSYSFLLKSISCMMLMAPSTQTDGSFLTNICFHKKSSTAAARVSERKVASLSSSLRVQTAREGYDDRERSTTDTVPTTEVVLLQRVLVRSPAKLAGDFDELFVVPEVAQAQFEICQSPLFQTLAEGG